MEGHIGIAQKEMETRPGRRVHAIYFTELHVDNNNVTRMPCLIMQYKPYIVELPPTMEADFM